MEINTLFSCWKFGSEEASLLFDNVVTKPLQILRIFVWFVGRMSILIHVLDCLRDFQLRIWFKAPFIVSPLLLVKPKSEQRNMTERMIDEFHAIELPTFLWRNFNCRLCCSIKYFYWHIHWEIQLWTWYLRHAINCEK